ncbi:hypothetical protein LXL04_002483 [Taraxacum kok-saghyz]
MSIGSSSQAGSRGRRRKVVTYDCGDVCSFAVARTKNNYGKKFYGCPNHQSMFKIEENFIAGSNEDLARSHCRVVGYYYGHVDCSGSKDVDITKYNAVEWFKGKIDINIDNGIHYIYHNVKLYENNWINGAPSGCKS